MTYTTVMSDTNFTGYAWSDIFMLFNSAIEKCVPKHRDTIIKQAAEDLIVFWGIPKEQVEEIVSELGVTL